LGLNPLYLVEWRIQGVIAVHSGYDSPAGNSEC
jgi:hypothetical protein